MLPFLLLVLLCVSFLCSFSIGHVSPWTQQAKNNAFTFCIRAENEMTTSSALTVHIRLLFLSSSTEVTCFVIEHLCRPSQALATTTAAATAAQADAITSPARQQKQQPEARDQQQMSRNLANFSKFRVPPTTDPRLFEIPSLRHSEHCAEITLCQHHWKPRQSTNTDVHEDMQVYKYQGLMQMIHPFTATHRQW